MADNTPTVPGGAMPPRPSEAAKVQPKKETVRINLPPKPTSAPTIKLPTLAPGTAPPSGAAAATAASAPPASGARMAAPAAPAKQEFPRVAFPDSTRMAAPGAPAKPSAPPRPMAPMTADLTGLDKGLAIAAAVASLAALGCVLYLAFFLKDTVAS